MAYRATCVALLLSTLLIAGCGTIVNLAKTHPDEGGRSPFGGVRQDVSCIEKAANRESGFRTHPDWELEQHRRAARMVLCTADLPLSLVGDVVTWPYTASYTFINQPVPLPPMTQSPTLPVQQAPAEARPETSPEESLPRPRELPPPSEENVAKPRKL
jgi:uncharacterized protein YceK